MPFDLDSVLKIRVQIGIMKTYPPLSIYLFMMLSEEMSSKYKSIWFMKVIQGERYSAKFFEGQNIKHFFMTVITPKTICIISIECASGISRQYILYFEQPELITSGLKCYCFMISGFFIWLKCGTNGSISESDLVLFFAHWRTTKKMVCCISTFTCCKEMWKNTFQSWMQPKKGLDLFATVFQVETFILSVFMWNAYPLHVWWSVECSL